MSEPIPIQDGRGLKQKQNGLGIGNPGDPSYTLTATGGASVMAFSSGQSANAYSLAIDDNVAPPLRACGGNNSMPTVPIPQNPMVFEPGALSRLEGHDPAEIAPTLRAHMGDNQLATYNETDEPRAVVENQRAEVRETFVTNALATGGGKPGQGYAAIRTESVVRRLTPMECERLQGFPDDHTRLRADGKEQANVHRYKQMGNAVAVPVVEWVIAGIVGIQSRG